MINPLGLTRVLAHKPIYRSIKAFSKLPQRPIICHLINRRTFTSDTHLKFSSKPSKHISTELPQVKSTPVPRLSIQFPSTLLPAQSPSSPSQTRPPSSVIWTVPNILTFTRIVTTPFIGYYIVTGNTKVALLIFVYSCVTDFIDGYIARKFKLQSVLGSIIDPLADKFLMTTCILSLAYINSIPLLVASLIIGRDVMLSFMSFYYRYQSLTPPRTLGKFLDLSGNPTISVHPNLLGKVNTALQMVYVGGLVFQPVIESLLATNLSAYSQGMAIVVSSTTVLSGLTYVFSKSSMKYIKK